MEVIYIKNTLPIHVKSAMIKHGISSINVLNTALTIVNSVRTYGEITEVIPEGILTISADFMGITVNISFIPSVNTLPICYKQAH